MGCARAGERVVTQTKEVIAHWLSTIQLEGRGLTKWEEDFVASLAEQFDRWPKISDRQEEILERIYAEKTA